MTECCPCCGSIVETPFYSVDRAPVHSVTVLRTPEAARAITSGEIALSFCPSCGFVFNAAYDETKQDYFHDYVSTQALSGVFNSFHKRLADDLIARHDLHGRRVVEIGCGQGEFLALLALLGGNEGIGFDPAYDETQPRLPNIRVVKEAYSDHHTDAAGDFIACKMTLEHIGNAAEFVGRVRRAVGNDRSKIVFFQVPDGGHVLNEGMFWDVYYEHCSYFTADSLAALFTRCGFAVQRVWRDYGAQYLMIEAVAAEPGAPPAPPQGVDETAATVRRFAREVPETLAAWREDLRHRHARGERTALWGGGSKAVAFLTTLDVGPEIVGAVDINPEKHGSFLARTAHPVLAPEALVANPVDRVVVMNPIYCGEVAAKLRSLGTTAEVVPVTAALPVPVR